MNETLLEDIKLFEENTLKATTTKGLWNFLTLFYICLVWQFRLIKNLWTLFFGNGSKLHEEKIHEVTKLHEGT